MELKKWMAVMTVALSTGATLTARAADPAKSPAVPPIASPISGPAAGASAAPPVDDTSGTRPKHKGRNHDRSISSGNVADAYAILKTRSIFVKGDQSISQNPHSSDVPSAPSGPLVGRQEASLVFNGVISVNGEADALVEDLGSHNVVVIRPGDPVAGGKVSSISFDDLAYETKGKTLHVEIGQNLEGTQPPDGALGDGSSTSPTTLPVNSGSGVTGGGGAVVPAGAAGEISADDLIAKMKARRLQESGGK